MHNSRPDGENNFDNRALREASHLAFPRVSHRKFTNFFPYIWQLAEIVVILKLEFGIFR